MNSQQFWDLLEEMQEAPTTLEFKRFWPLIDQALNSFPLEQLPMAAEAIDRLAEVLEVRAEQWLKDWQDQYSPEGPTLNSDLFAGLVRKSVQIDWEDLKAAPEPPHYKKHGSHLKPSRFEDSVVAVVEKEKLLAVVEEIMTIEKLRQLTGEEDIERWRQAIAQYLHYLQTYPQPQLSSMQAPVRLVQIQRALEMPLVELWMGLLLGGYTLEQQGEFYDPAGIVVHV
jgi:hypothetical protein